MLKALNQELKLSYREYFESKLAKLFLVHSDKFHSVENVSKNISYMLSHKENINIIIKKIQECEKIKEELYKQGYFGRLDNQPENPEGVLKQICATLEKQTKETINQIMQIHAVFIHRLYDDLPCKMFEIDKTPLVDSIFKNSGFFKNRNRDEINQNSNLTNQYGFCRNLVFAKKIGTSEILHYRAIDRFKCTLSVGEGIPLVASHSGHTGSLLLGAKLYGELNNEELKEYAFACFCFLGLGGNHSFYEVMQVATTVGLPFQENNYEQNMPVSIKESLFYKELLEEFPDFLEAPSLNNTFIN